MEEKIERLVNWAKGKKEPPTTIELIPTDKCNSICKTCWRRNFTEQQLDERVKNEMTNERILELIEEAAKLGVLEIAMVGGGEPLARNITFDIMKKIKEFGMCGDIVTNGTFLNEKIIQFLVNSDWERIKFSIDGPNAKIHDYLRGINCFDDVVKNIKKLSELKRRLKADKPRIIFNTVISDVNYRLLPNIVRLANKVGCEEMLLLPMTVFADSMKDMKLNEGEMKEFQGILLNSMELTKKFNIDTNFRNFLNTKYVEKTDKMDEVIMEEVEVIKKEYLKKDDPIENFKFLPCFDPWYHVTILANGNIAPCFGSWVWETNVSIKNYTLKELWYGEYFNKFRDIMLTRKLPKSCATCCVWKVFENRNIRDRIEKYIKGDFLD
jgi:MoaA/NifB/PqqE/SkfB family radical SAM enzyme